ncbi:MAG: transcription termination factor Rho [Puniceicoccales bacterium]|jgi:transcription termination factor Rho|nr:transcription termination factor Rho [Puniceicoccales bacterium]
MEVFEFERAHCRAGDGKMEETFLGTGLFESNPGGAFGRLVNFQDSGRSASRFIHVPQSIFQRFHLRDGQEVVGSVAPGRNGKNPFLVRVDSIDGLSPEERRKCVSFFRATTIFPAEWFRLETDGGPLGTRIIDLFAPIGKGQRGLIVAPPKAGKTTLLRDIAHGIIANHPGCHLMVLLVDERPEEVTDFRRSVTAEIFASSNDEPMTRHLQVAQFAFQRAQCLVEAGRDVVLLLDSLTRLARTFNGAAGRGGRTMSGGLDSKALEKPRQLFSMARATEEIGTLTILATVLVETGSRMDDLIFQEFKGTGNAEIVLDRRLAEQRLFPAINLQSTGTRREELLLDERTLQAAQFMRRAAASGRPEAALENLLIRLGKTKNNREFVDFIAKR